MKKALFIVLALAFTVYCAKKSSPVGSDLFDRINDNSVSQKNLYTVVVDTLYQTSVNMGNSAYLYVGRQNDIRAHTLIKFITRPDSGQLDSTVVKMFISRALSETSSPMTVHVYECLAPWEEFEIRWETWEQVQNGFLGPELDQFTVNPESDSVTFYLPSDRVRAWADSTEPNNGVLLTSEDADYIMEFYSRNASTDDTTETVRHPFSTSYVSQDGDTLISSRLASQDAVLASRKIDPTGDRVWIHNGLGMRTFIQVAVEGIPEDATVNKAYLVLYPDTTLSFPDNDTYDLLAYPVIEENWILPYIPYDIGGVQPGAIKGDSAFVDITFFLQNWIFGSEENYGIVLKGAQENTNLLSRSFYTSTAADSTKRPYIKLYYSLPPASRY